MRMPKRLLYAVSWLALAAACGGKDVSLVTVMAPEASKPSSFSFVKYFGTRHQSDLTIQTPGARPYVLAVEYPRGMRDVTVFGFAEVDGRVIAEGKVDQIESIKESSAALVLDLCSESYLGGDTRSRCVGDRGYDAGGSTDSRANTDTEERGADASQSPEAGLFRDASMNPNVCRGDPGPIPVDASADSLTDAPCGTYCQHMQQYCPATYGTFERCYGICTRIPDDNTSRANDTLKCRDESAKNTPVTAIQGSCDSADFHQLRGCGVPCYTYCRIGEVVCPETFGDREDCTLACLKAYQTLPRPQDALACRMRLLVEAALEPTLCWSASPKSACSACNGREASLDTGAPLFTY